MAASTASADTDAAWLQAHPFLLAALKTFGLAFLFACAPAVMAAAVTAVGSLLFCGASALQPQLAAQPEHTHLSASS